MQERLQKILAAGGAPSRRAAEEWIRAGRVTVNGRPAQLGDRADPERDEVAVDGKPVARPSRRYWILNKPRGVLTTRRDPFGRATVMELLPAQAREVFPVGRLDRDTEGLLVLTNDGDVAQALLHPSLGTEKEYRVTARGVVPAAKLRELAEGVELRDGRTAPARVSGVRFDRREGTTRFHLVLREGRKRQIRRALSKLGHPVQHLVRIRMGPLRLGRLPTGQARPLTGHEVRVLQSHADRLRVAAARHAAGTSRAGNQPRQPGAAARKRRRETSRPSSPEGSKFLDQKEKRE